MPRFLTLRFALFYTALFLAFGVALPFLPRILDARGLSEFEIGALFALSLGARAVIGPAAVLAMDRALNDRAGLILLAAISAAGFAGIGAFGEAKAMIFVLAPMALLAIGIIIPYSDIAALHYEAEGAMNYGRARAAGSAAFIIANIFGGLLIAHYSIEAGLVWIIAASTVLIAAGGLIPAASRRAGAPMSLSRGVRAAFRQVLTRRHLPFLIAVSFIQASHAVYYAFSAIEWTRNGLSGLMIGALWAIGVVAEVIFLLFSRRLIGGLGPARLLMLAGAGAAIRWLTISASPPLALLFAVQTTHALSFAATHLATIYFVKRTAPPHLAGAALTAVSSVAIGAATALTTLAMGPVYAAYGAGAYLAMAAMGALGFAAALVLRLGNLAAARGARVS